MAELAAARGLSVSEASDLVLAMTGGERDVHSRAAALVELVTEEAEVLGLAVSAEAREKYAKSGVVTHVVSIKSADAPVSPGTDGYGRVR